MWNGIVDPIAVDWKNGDYQSAGGRAGAEITMLIAGPKGTGALARAGEGASAASRATTATTAASRVSPGARYLYDNWHKSTFDSRSGSITYHLARHGKGRSAVQYTQDAMDFFARNKHIGVNVTLKDGSPGIGIKTKLQGPNGKTVRVGGYWTNSGKLVTYWD